MHRIELLETLARVVRDMRRLQKEYFKSREITTLRECKGCELHVDALLAKLAADPQMELL